MPMGAGLIDPRYCCCAVPLVNAGISMILGEQAIVGVVAGVVAIATPTVVGASIPTFGTYIFAILCFVVTLVQPIGFIGVIREKTSTFKVYSLLNALAVAAAFICAAALIIVSALHHDTAVTSCENKFFSDSSNSTSSTANQTLHAESEALCSAFAWADVGIMGGLWVMLFLLQAYFIYLTRTYSTSQVKDHKLYHSVYSENPEAFTMSILRSTRYNPGSVYNNMPAPVPGAGPHADAWDTRPSMESLRDERPDGYGADGQGYDRQSGYDEPAPGYERQSGYHEPGQGGYGGHERGFSDATIRQDEDQGRYDDAYAEGSHAYPNTYEGYENHTNGQGQGQYPFSAPGGGYIDHPAEARFGRDPGITPTANMYTEGQGVGYNAGGYPSQGGGGGLRRPEEIQNHPAEGMFGRKSPRYE